MLVGDIFQQDAPIIAETSTLVHASETFIKFGTSDLMVVDSLGNFIGVLSEGDLIRKCMPKYNELIAEGLSLEDIFRLFTEKGRTSATETIMGIVITNPITVLRSTHIQKAAAYMFSKNIRRLPVVEEGKLIGSLSRAMVAKAILTGV
jgi:CBS domain-containing protein